MAGFRNHDFFDDHNDLSNGGNTSEDSSIDARPAESSSFVEDTAAESSRVEGENDSADVVDNYGDGDRDLFFDEDTVLRWLQALDMQVTGACRADERLKPLLKLNVSNGVAEDRLLAHLSQHFEPAEIGMLARCFCIPLVSVRVGKIKKEGTRMCPTTTRGNLSLMLLPTSELRLSFVGDNGRSERLFSFSSKFQSSAVSVEDITADTSGRSFVIRIPDGHAFYYWCSEKSKLLGMELRRKMKDLIRKKPSISELTGIEESRLGCVALHLRLYLMGSVVPNIKGCPSFSLDSSSGCRDLSSSSLCSSKSLRTRHSGSQSTKASSFHQGSLSPRSSSFKENTQRNSSLRISSRDKSRRRGDGPLSAFDNLHVASNAAVEASVRAENEAGGDGRLCLLGLEGAGSETKSGELPRSLIALKAGPPPVYPPYYCWCPPNTSTLHSPAAASQQLSSLPPLSSLLPPSGSGGILNPPGPLDLSEIPTLLPDSFPLVRLPISSSQQIPMFTPLMCEPIVHIPVIDVCSSGQGYLVSAGPGIPPLHQNLISPVVPHRESLLLEEGARETLRLLISGSSTTTAAAPLINVLTKSEDREGIVVTGGRGLYNGTRHLEGSSASLFAPIIGLQQPVASGSSSSSKGPDTKPDARTDGCGGSGESVP